MTLHVRNLATHAKAGPSAEASGRKRPISKTSLLLALVALLVALAISACGGGSETGNSAQSQATLASEWGYTEGGAGNQPNPVSSPRGEFKLIEVTGAWYSNLLPLALFAGVFLYLLFGPRRRRGELLGYTALSGLGSFAVVLAFLLFLDGCAF